MSETSEHPEQALVIANPPSTLLAKFGSTAEIAEYARRLKATMFVRTKGGGQRKLYNEEALRLASASLMHQLDPYTGEVQIIPDRQEENQGSLYVSPDAYLRKANEQLQKNGGGAVSSEFRQIIEADERAQLSIPPKAIAFECIVRDTQTIRAWTSLLDALSKFKDATWEQASKIAGERPGVSAVAWYVPAGGYVDEQFAPLARAKKRALKAALKIRFSLTLSEDESEGHLPDEFRGKLDPDAAGRPTVVENKPKVQQSEPEPPTGDPAVWQASQKRAQHEKAKQGSAALFTEG